MTINEYTPEQWVVALKTQRYRHAQNQLGWRKKGARRIDACCLGVMAVDMGIATFVVPYGCADETKIEVRTSDNCAEDCDLPVECRPKWLTDKCMGALIEINDDGETVGYGKQIEYIEKHIIKPRRRKK